MYVVTVQFVLDSTRGDAFLPLMLENAKTSRDKEPGCLRFDVCRSETDASIVYLYEIYRSRADFDEHLASTHFKSFDQATAGMVASKVVQTFQLLDS